MSKAYVFLADGFEEVEALAVVDLLRRGGVDTVMVSISDSLELVGRSRISVKADAMYEDCHFSDASLYVLPGGLPGTTYLGRHEGLCRLLKTAAEEKKVYIGAICAAPTILGKLGLLDGKKATCYPGLENELTGAKVSTDKKVVKDGKIITSRGVGTVIPFALRLIECLMGEECAKEVERSIVFN